MGYGDYYYWGLYRDYYRHPFPHSLLSTREDPHDSAQNDKHCQSDGDGSIINPKLVLP